MANFSKKKWILLDIDNCMYNGFNPDGTFVEYKKHMRAADEGWAVSLTGDLEGLRNFRQKMAAIIGMDRSLLQFISDKTGKKYWINELAAHRCGENGYHPEKHLEHDVDLVECLRLIKAQNIELVAVTDNPNGRKTLRILGVDSDIIPDNLVFDSIRMGDFKNPDSLRYVLDVLKATPDEAVVFGDSEASDIIPAREAGIDAHLVGGRDELLSKLRTLFIDNYGN